MVEQTEVDRRRELLAADLTIMTKHYGKWAKTNYLSAYLIRLVSVAASLAAGLGGLTTDYTTVFALIALIPAAFLIITANFKIQDKANWHYRKKDAVNGLRNKLLFELPDPPTAASIAEISQSLSKLNERMSKEWEESFGMDSALVEKSSN